VSIFEDQKRLLAAVILILLCSVATGQVAAAITANDFKREMIRHDYAVAGYLVSNNVSQSQIASAFTSEKNSRDIAAGQTLLQAAGYDQSLSSNLLPAVENFHQRYALLAFMISLVFSLAIASVLVVFFMRQNRRLEQAQTDILAFMDGNHDIRLNDNEEGNLGRLFSSVNMMATSLTAHFAREQQRKEFLRDMISNISHQLKTPLAALQMYSEIIDDENDGNQAVSDFTRKSQNELERMENLIQNLLKLARLDAGTITLEKRNCPLRDLMEKAVSRFTTRADIENKSVTLDCDDSTVLNCDEGWLMEAVCNLIKNSLDHTDAGATVAVIVDESPVLTRITIKDNGRGIHPEDIHHIFKRFYRSRFSQDKQGIGIGLTLTKAIVEKHGGSIMAESEWGKGTAFHLTFPKLTNL
jgi:signal transduction histidine kinase